MGQKDTKLFDGAIPDSVIVQCPEIGFDMRRVKKCLTCEFYGGFAKATMNGEPLPFNVKNLQVICIRPVTRALVQVSED